MRIKNFLVMFLLVMIVLLVAPNVTKASSGSGWWNMDWKYRRPISLNPATPESDYQVKIVLTPDNFNYSKANPDGSDIRFCQANGTKLSYWIEEWNPHGNSTIWVKVAQKGTDTIYMYYGNSSAKSESNGTSTFTLFNDFEGSLTTGFGTWVRTEAGGSLDHVTDYYQQGNYSIMQYQEDTSHNQWVEERLKIDLSGTRVDAIRIYNIAQGEYPGYSWWAWSRVGFCITDGSNSYCKDTMNIGKNREHPVEVYNQDTANGSVIGADGRTWYYYDFVVPDDWDKNNIKIELITDADGGDQHILCKAWAWWDIMFVRKYASPEPTATIGEEEVAMPTEPQLIGPDEDSSTNDTTPTFRWQPAMYADNHTLLVDNQTDFSSPEINVTLGSDVTSYTVPGANQLSEGKWYWKVIASNMYGKNESDVWNFIVDKTPPLPPKLKSPPDGYVTDDRGVTFVWNSTQDNTTNSSYVSGIDHYEIQIDDDPNFTSPLTYTSADTSITKQVEGRLYWRVRAWDRAGNPSKFSEVRRLIVFSFTLSTSSSNLQMMKGSSLSINISTSVEFGEPENISFNYSWTGDIKPSRINLTFSSSTVYGTNSSVLTIASENTASTGTFTCRIFATSESGIERYINVKITIYGMLFSIFCFPQDVTLTRSDEKSISVSVEFDQGALDIVSFSGKWIGDSPEGISISINPSSGVPPFESTVVVSASRNAQQGDYIYQLTATGSGLTRTINIYVHVRTDLSLEINTDRETYERGDVIKFYGTVKDPFGEEVDDGTVKIQITAENRSLCCMETKVTSGKFEASYCITFDKPLGKWLISATATDNKGDTTRNASRMNIFVEASEGHKHYSINILSPSYGQVFRRGETITFSVMVTEGDEKISGVNLKGYLSNGDTVTFTESSFGIYSCSYTLSYDCNIGNWSIYIEGKKEEDGKIESGYGSVSFKVEPVKPLLQVIQQPVKTIEAGDNIEIEVKILYPDGTPVNEGIVKTIGPDGKEILFKRTGPGVYKASVSPSMAENWSIKLMVEDAYGNVASFNVGEVSVIPPRATTYIVRYWWASALALVSTLLTVGYFAHRRLMLVKLMKLRREILELERLKKVAATRYFLKGEISRKTYDELLQGYESRIAELSREYGLLMRKIRRRKKNGKKDNSS